MKSNQPAVWIRASGHRVDRALTLLANLEIEAEAAAETSARNAEAKPKARKFSMVAYNGGAMRIAGFYNPVVVDLAGLSGIGKARPIFKNHDPEQLVGHADQVAVEGSTLKAAGYISGGGEHARQVTDAHDAGFPWQASIGASVTNMENVKEGSSATANGRTFNGPINIARRAVLGEISFVPLGADDSTSAQIAAQSAEKAPMTFEQWLKARGLVLDGLSTVQAAAYRAVFDAEVTAGFAHSDAPAKPADKAADKPAAVQASGGDAAADLKKVRAEIAAESERVNTIRSICAKAEHPKLKLKVDGKEQEVDIEAHAIRENWDATKVELEVLRASRPKAPGVIVRDDSIDAQTIEAALCLAGGLKEVPSLRAGKPRPIHDVFPEKTLDAAQRRFPRGIGLQQLLLEAAWANGYTGRSFRDDMRGVLRAAMVRADGFSTFSLPGILSNTANKYLIVGFTAVEQAWRRISAIRSVADFKTATSYRMTGAMQFEKVGPDGEIKHGTLGETAFTNKAETYAKMLAITRQDMRNDDLGALTQAPQRLGRGAALKLNDVFWTTFVNNSAFFTSGRANYFTGAATNLQSSSLATAEQKFADQTDEDGKPIAVMPAILLVPTALKRTAVELMSAAFFVAGGGATGAQIPAANTWQGVYEVVVSAYLGNSAYTGNSQLAWYLLADPKDMPTIEVAFLDGQEAPIVEETDADFDTLGIQMRGYYDFGVGTQEYRGGVKSKGAA